MRAKLLEQAAACYEAAIVDLPFSTPDLPGVGGSLRTEVEDFQVEELGAYEPCGQGPHTFLWVEKRNLTTLDALQRLGAALGFDARAAGYAGMKDRRAVTRQWISVEGVEPEQVIGFSVDGVRVLAASRHDNRLKTGHLSANRFEVVLRGASDLGLARAIAGRIGTEGFANFFGEQRFGREGDNAERARAWLLGRTPPVRDGRLQRLLASAWQSELFNRALARRMADGGHSRAIAGDLCVKHESGGVFYELSPEILQPRLDSLEVSVTGPLFGARMRWPKEDALAFEQEILRAEGVDSAILQRERKLLPGGRRPYRAFSGPLEVTASASGLRLRFVLPAGSYATVVLREFTKVDQPHG